MLSKIIKKQPKKIDKSSFSINNLGFDTYDYGYYKKIHEKVFFKKHNA